jgi:hypothetical protein
MNLIRIRSYHVQMICVFVIIFRNYGIIIDLIISFDISFSLVVKLTININKNLHL